MPILISTPQDLDNIKNNLSGDFELANDIDMGSFGNFTPIGKSDNFTGQLDGKGHIISNLTINDTSNYNGLFGKTSGAIIKNIGLENVNIGTGMFSGALVGLTQNNSYIENCYSKTGIITTSNYCGGLIGYNSVTTIKNCYSQVEVGTSTSTNVGGFVGRNESTTIENCYSTGKVNGSSYTGGFCGSNLDTITNCYYDKTTSGKTDSTKGIPLTTAQMKTQSSFVNWDFDTIWSINEGIDYPTLQVFASSAPPLGTIEERQVLSYLNDIYSSIKANKSVEKQVNSYILPIVSDVETGKGISININSHMKPIYGNVLSENKINQIINVLSYMKPIKSNTNRQVIGFRQPTSYIKVIDSKVILPGIISPFVYANSSTIENLSNTSCIENPSHLEVMV